MTQMVSLKLISGDLLISELSSESMTHLSLTKPMVAQQMHDQGRAFMYMTVFNPFDSKKTTYEISKTQIVFRGGVDDDLITVYKSYNEEAQKPARAVTAPHGAASEAFEYLQDLTVDSKKKMN